MAVNIFRAAPIESLLLPIKKSLRTPLDNETIHISKYGNEE